MLVFTGISISLHIVKTVRNIFSYLLVLMFLIPATGFYYTRHSCLKSGHVQLVLDGNYTCCNMESSGHTNTGMECAVEGSSSDCCINEGNYLKSKDEYTPPGKTEIPHIEIIITATLFSIDLFPDIQETLEEKAHSPPFILSSVDILHRHSVLLI